MRSEYILLQELRNVFGYIYYVFKHIESNKLVYFMTVVGDGFVQSESITKEIFDYAMERYFKESEK